MRNHLKECLNTVIDATFKKGHECESTGRLTRKRPISYEQLYPSLFSRRRKSSTMKTPTMTQLNIFDSVESDNVQFKSGTGDGDVLSECLPSKPKRKRGQNSISDNKYADDKSFSEKMGLDKSIYDSGEGK
ncbi:unnamed protein product, partial [Onchocerca flexuosa]